MTDAAPRQDRAASARIPHVDALDGLRGLAVAGVLLFHGGHLAGGYLGVDLFFVLSGFLITSLLLAESGATGSIGLGGFWPRRARRLLPALALLLVGVALYSVAFASRDQLPQIRSDAFATLGYVANWHEIFTHLDYWALFRAPSPLNHTWSLAIEEQFYVVWPLLFVAILSRWKRSTPRAVLVVSLALAAASTALMLILYRASDPGRAYFGTDTRAAAILFGAALAAWTAMRGPTRTRPRRTALEVAGALGVVVLAVAWTRLDGQSATLYRGGFLVCGLAATAVIAAAVHPERGPIARALSWKPLCALGLISYGVYLYHWPIDLALDSKQMHFSGWPLLGFQTAVTLAVALVSFQFVERPIRRGALSAVQWRRLTPAVAVGVAIAIVATTTGAGSTSTYASVMSTAHPLTLSLRAYKHAPADAQRLLLVGDSVALALGPSFGHLRTTPALAVLDAGIPGCVFPPNLVAEPLRFPDGRTLPSVPCNPNWEAGIVERFRPDLVIWIMSGTRVSTYHGKSITPCSPEYSTLFKQGLAEQIGMFRKVGARVVVTTAAYSRSVGLAHGSSDRKLDCDNHLRRTYAAAYGAQLVDLFSYVCPGGRCRKQQDGVVLRSDGMHYEGPGGNIVARWLLDQSRAGA